MTLGFIVGGLLRTRLGTKDELSQCVSEILSKDHLMAMLMDLYIYWVLEGLGVHYMVRDLKASLEYYLAQS